MREHDVSSYIIRAILLNLIQAKELCEIFSAYTEITDQRLTPDTEF